MVGVGVQPLEPTMISFFLPAALLQRLANLHHAADSSNPRSLLHHIHLQARNQHARLAATDGKILAIVTTATMPDPQCDQPHDQLDVDVILDSGLFTRAIRTLLRPIGRRYDSIRIEVDQRRGEVRLERGTSVSAVVRLIDGTFPRYQAALDRYHDAVFVPAIATFDPDYLSTLARMIGNPRVTPMLWSPAPASTPVGVVWQAMSRIPEDATCSVRALAELVSGRPGIWADESLLVLIMPIGRVLDPDRPSTIGSLFGQVAAALTAAAIEPLALAA